MILGIFYGFGYCPFTDWHYDVLTRLGHTDLPASYIQYLLEKFFHLDVAQRTTDTFTLLGLVVALISSVYVNFFKRKGGKQEAI